MRLFDMTDAQIDRAVENYWDRVWERMNAPDPYDLARQTDIDDFVLNNFEDELEEEQEESPYLTEEEILQQFIRHNEDMIRDRYNEHWSSKYGRF